MQLLFWKVRSQDLSPSNTPPPPLHPQHSQCQLWKLAAWEYLDTMLTLISFIAVMQGSIVTLRMQI